jgi:hypothetical protein
MLKPLQLRPTPKNRETIPSFLSRIAAMNGVSAKNFAVDMGFSLKKAVLLDDAALSSLASCGGLTGSQLEELVSWTGKKAEGVSKTFRDEVFVSRAVRNPIIRGCPICLREDAEIAPSQPLGPVAV